MRTHLVLNQLIHQWARAAMTAQGFDKFNEYVAHLIRSDAELRGLAHTPLSEGMQEMDKGQDTEEETVAEHAQAIRSRIQDKKNQLKRKTASPPQ